MKLDFTKYEPIANIKMFLKAGRHEMEPNAQEENTLKK